MKKTPVLISILITFSFGLVMVYGDAPAYSLGTMQPMKTYVTSPGKNVSLTFYIFNAYGNRISHITLAVGDNPDNLVVDLPPLETHMWNISGILTPIQEHMYVEPMPIVEEQPANPPAGIYYLRSTNVSGFIPARMGQVIVEVPANAQLGTQYALTIMAAANWYGELGTSQVSQARPFNYIIQVVAENYSESLYNPPATETGKGGGGLSNETIFGIIIVVLVVVVLFQQFRPKRR
jgi:hypothetical protein